MVKPEIFQYDDYRAFLRDWYVWRKETKPGFSYRAFSKWAGFKSPNQLLLVINGKRNIALSSLEKYTGIIGFSKQEFHYFELLVKFHQSKDMKSRALYLKEICSYQLSKGLVLKGNQYQYLSNWYYSAIREMVNLSEFIEKPSWIARKLGGLITPDQAKKAIQTLLDLGLLKREAGGRLKQEDSYITTGNETAAVAATLYHEQMIQLARESLFKVAATDRNLTALTFTMRKTDYKFIVEEINDFRKKVIAYLQGRSEMSKEEVLYQLNIHLFPIVNATPVANLPEGRSR